MFRRLIPNYEFVENWSEDELIDFITTHSHIPYDLMSIVREVIPNINTLRLCAMIKYPEIANINDSDERAVTHRLLSEDKFDEAQEYHVQWALEFLEEYPQFKPMIKGVESGRKVLLTGLLDYFIHKNIK